MSKSKTSKSKKDEESKSASKSANKKSARKSKSKTKSVKKGMTQEDEKIKLYYFDCYGRAEAIRMLLNISCVEFEDIAYKMDEWESIKSDEIF